MQFTVKLASQHLPLLRSGETCTVDSRHRPTLLIKLTVTNAVECEKGFYVQFLSVFTQKYEGDTVEAQLLYKITHFCSVLRVMLPAAMGGA